MSLIEFVRHREADCSEHILPGEVATGGIQTLLPQLGFKDRVTGTVIQMHPERALTLGLTETLEHPQQRGIRYIKDEPVENQTILAMCEAAQPRWRKQLEKIKLR